MLIPDKSLSASIRTMPKWPGPSSPVLFYTLGILFLVGINYAKLTGCLVGIRHLAGNSLEKNASDTFVSSIKKFQDSNFPLDSGHYFPHIYIKNI